MTLPATLGPFIYDILYHPRHRFDQRLEAALDVVRDHMPEKVEWVREQILCILNTDPHELASEKCPDVSWTEQQEWLQHHPICLSGELLCKFYNHLGLSTWLEASEFTKPEYDRLRGLPVDQENLHKWQGDPFGMRWHFERSRNPEEFDAWYWRTVYKIDKS